MIPFHAKTVRDPRNAQALCIYSSCWRAVVVFYIVALTTLALAVVRKQGVRADIRVNCDHFFYYKALRFVQDHED